MTPKSKLQLAILVILILYLFIGCRIEPNTHNVDLPEEIDALSTDANHPDTLLGYKSHNTIHITFTGKHR